MMSDFVNTIDLLGDETVSLAIIGRTITEFNDDIITNVGEYAFSNCNKLTSIDLPNVATIGKYAFSACSLTSINAPNVTRIMEYGLSGCYFTSIDLPNLVTIDRYAFNYCKSLTHIALPNAESISSYAFYQCTSLKTIDISKNLKIFAWFGGFSNAFTELILRSKTLCPLDQVASLGGTPFSTSGKSGTVYVPQALIESYQNATNWSRLYSQGTCNFVAIEGSEYE